MKLASGVWPQRTRLLRVKTRSLLKFGKKTHEHLWRRQRTWQELCMVSIRLFSCLCVLRIPVFAYCILKDNNPWRISSSSCPARLYCLSNELVLLVIHRQKNRLTRENLTAMVNISGCECKDKLEYSRQGKRFDCKWLSYLSLYPRFTSWSKFPDRALKIEPQRCFGLDWMWHQRRADGGRHILWNIMALTTPTFQEIA